MRWAITRSDLESSFDSKDDRVFLNLELVFDRSLPAFQLRPFIDKGALIGAKENKMVINKSYFLYHQNITENV